MDSKKTRKIIAEKCAKFLEALPKTLQKKCLLTGGAAAFLYGSDRPFSDDIDFMVPREKAKNLGERLGVKFAYRKKKSVFHSLAASAEIKGVPYDLIAKSVIEPTKGKVFSFWVTPELYQKRRVFKVLGAQIACQPPEFLVASKLLAGRGLELGKYDLVDVGAILKNFKEFDWAFFGHIIKTFCRPLKDSLPILKAHTKKMNKEVDREAASLLLGYLSTLR